MSIKFPNYIPAEVQEHLKIFIEHYTQKNIGSEYVASMKRLANDPRMKEVYGKIKNIMSEEDQRNLIYSAWAAKENYQKARENSLKIKSVLGNVKKFSGKLRESLIELESCDLCMPSIFYSIPRLLENTDSWRGDQIDYFWRKERKAVLNSSAWSIAPDFPDLLETIQNYAKIHEPQLPNNKTGAALQSRKRTERSEYMRAFMHLLIEEHKMNISSALFPAIATITDVVLNDPAVSTSTDDVRKALTFLAAKKEQINEPEA